MTIFHELKRRNVFRIAGVYTVVGWLLMQVAGQFEEALQLPEWFDSVITASLIIGFPVALLLAWAFEMTPEGVKRAATDANTDDLSAKVSKTDGLILIGMIAILFVAIWQQLSPTNTTQKPQQITDTQNENSPDVNTLSKKKPGVIKDFNSNEKIIDASIAVLPFADLSQQGDQEYFSDGIAEEILNVLVRIDDLKVASRTSAFGYKGKESLGIPTIAQQLKVRHILEGSVRKSGETVRITAQLIDAQTDAHLWSQTFDRKLTTENIFQVQDEIATAIVRELGLLIGSEKQENHSVKVLTQNLNAYELYLKAQSLFHKRTFNNITEIMDLYQQATTLDPDFAEAWAGLGAVYLVSPGWGYGKIAEFFPKAQQAADRATQLDDSLAIPYAIRSSVIAARGDIISASEQMEMALKREPNNPQVLYASATDLLDMGYLAQAEKRFRRCLELDPNYEICRRFLSFALLYQGQTEEASELFEIGQLRGQSSYIDVFLQYYGYIGDKRALALTLASIELTPIWWREISYRYHLDSSYSYSEFLDTIMANNPDPFILEWATLAPEETDLIADLLWSPYLAVHKRAELQDEYQKIRTNTIIKYGIDDYWRKHGYPPQCRPDPNSDIENAFQCD